MAKKLTYIISTFLFLMTANPGLSAEAEGTVYYLNEGEVVHREMDLVVPSRGQGAVKLSSGEVTLSTTHFFSYEKKGATVFYAIFHGSESDGYFEGSMVFRGKYLRGSNMAIWDGDIYLSDKEIDHEMSDEAVKESCEEGTFTYTGGFFFHTIID